MRFYRISDEIVNATDEFGNTATISVDEAIELGYRPTVKQFTYQGKLISISKFGRLINKNGEAIRHMCNRYEYTTGEQVIKHYSKLKEVKCFTYQGNQMSVAEFAKLIRKKASTIHALRSSYGYNTGEEIIEHYRKYNENRRLTYQGKPITVAEFSSVIGRPTASVQSICAAHKYSTGEEIIEHIKKFEDAHRKIGYDDFTYQGKPILVSEFARVINETYAKIYKIAYKHGYRTGEEIIQHLEEQEKNKKVFTYKGEKLSVLSFARLISKNEGTIDDIVRKHGYKTGEEVLQYLKDTKQPRVFTYQGKIISQTDFARHINQSPKTINELVRRYDYRTGEEVIEHLNRQKEHEITYQGKVISKADFAKILNVPAHRVALAAKKYKTGEEIIEYFNQLAENASKLTYLGKTILVKNFAASIGKSYSTIKYLIDKYGYSTGEEIIEHYKKKGIL